LRVSLARLTKPVVDTRETAEKEVQGISCQGSGRVPHLQKSPKIGGLGG
jgi:hypothetical protein